MSSLRKGFLFGFVVAFSLEWSLGSAVAQVVRKYHQKDERVSFHEGTQSFTVVFEPEYEYFETTILPIPSSEFSFFNFDWHHFFNSLVGTEAVDLEQQNHIFGRITSQLNEIVDQQQFSTAQLVSLVFSFVKQLGVKPRPRTNEEAMLLPVDLLHLGPKTRRDYLVLSAALLSSLCVEIQMVEMAEKWNLAVLASESLEGETYNVDGLNYLFVDGVADQDQRSNNGRALASTIAINERCIENEKYRAPLKAYPNHVASRFLREVEGIDDIAQARVRNPTRRGWEVSLGSTVANLQALRSDKEIGYLFDRDGEGPSRPSGYNHLLMFGNRGGQYGTVGATRVAGGKP